MSEFEDVSVVEMSSRWLDVQKWSSGVPWIVTKNGGTLSLVWNLGPMGSKGRAGGKGLTNTR